MHEQAGSRVFVWVAVAVLLAATGYRLLAGRDSAPPPVSVAGASAQADPAAAGETAGAGPEPGSGARIYVHVAGAVRRPGLYRLPAGARVATALELAGGPSSRAELTGVNLAARVEDGQQVIVPLRDRATAPTGAGPAAGSGSGGGGVGAAGSSGSAVGGRLSLATATLEQLERLDGIGPALARRILEYREAHGGFRSVDELGEVDGIGEKRLEALRQAVRP